MQRASFLWWRGGLGKAEGRPGFDASPMSSGAIPLAVESTSSMLNLLKSNFSSFNLAC